MNNEKPLGANRVLLINRFPFWLYSDPHYFLDGIEELCILHTKENPFDFPANKYQTAVICDFSEQSKVDDAVEYLYKHHQFDVVLNLTERYMEMAARVREKYSIPGMSSSTAKKFRDKLEMKKVLQNAGLKVPRSKKITSKEEIQQFVTEYGKSVIKPVDGMGTHKTYVIDHFETVDSILREVDDLSKYEIEEFITGAMYHCDSVIENGEIKLCSVSRYLNSTLDYSTDGYLASVMINEGELRDRIVEFNRKVIEAFDYQNGVTHHELFLSGSELVFCEIAARAGGAGVIPSIKAAYGVNLFDADLRLQLNLGVHIPQVSEKKYAGWLLIHSKEGIVTEIRNMDDYNFNWLYYKNIKAKRGDLLKKADNSVASVADFTITGSSEEDVVHKILMIINDFKMKTM